jgi:uncharacterized surface protein with fasciclin (FAS1) repeats
MRQPLMATMLIAAAALGLAACGKNDASPDAAASSAAAGATSGKDLFDTLGDASDLSESARLVKAAGLEKTFEGVGSYTLFAPTNAAIAALPEDTRKALESEEGKVQLLALVSQHLSPGYIGRADLEDGLTRAKGTVRLASLGGQPIALHREGDVIRLGEGADAPRLVGEPIIARNGVIYPIDRVLPVPE